MNGIEALTTDDRRLKFDSVTKLKEYVSNHANAVKAVVRYSFEDDSDVGFVHEQSVFGRGGYWVWKDDRVDFKRNPATKTFIPCIESVKILRGPFDTGVCLGVTAVLHFRTDGEKSFFDSLVASEWLGSANNTNFTYFEPMIQIPDGDRHLHRTSSLSWFLRNFSEEKDYFITQICETCGQVISPYPLVGFTDGRRRYCSEECRREANNRVRRVPKKINTCLYCGAQFEGKRAGAKFCCDAHKMAYHRKKER